MEEYNITYAVNEDYVHTLTIPRGCYVLVAGDYDTENYEVFHNGRRVNNVYAVVFRASKETVKNWKEIIEKGE